ncbi:MAG: hypothetical protein ABIO02_03765 [Patescibacteria group bacterium]
MATDQNQPSRQDLIKQAIAISTDPKLNTGEKIEGIRPIAFALGLPGSRQLDIMPSDEARLNHLVKGLDRVNDIEDRMRDSEAKNQRYQAELTHRLAEINQRYAIEAQEQLEPVAREVEKMKEESRNLANRLGINLGPERK